MHYTSHWIAPAKLAQYNILQACLNNKDGPLTWGQCESVSAESCTVTENFMLADPEHVFLCFANLNIWFSVMYFTEWL